MGVCLQELEYVQPLRGTTCLQNLSSANTVSDSEAMDALKQSAMAIEDDNEKTAADVEGVAVAPDESKAQGLAVRVSGDGQQRDLSIDELATGSQSAPATSGTGANVQTSRRQSEIPNSTPQVIQDAAIPGTHSAKPQS